MTDDNPTFDIVKERPDIPDVQALLQRHFDLMRAQSPEESCHVLQPVDLFHAGAVLLAARDDDTLLGVGAIVPYAPDAGELKSMHTAAEARGRGVGRALLAALFHEAHAMGLTRLSLETGSAAAFAPARALYAAHGFEICPPFGDHVLDPISVFMSRAL